MTRFVAYCALIAATFAVQLGNFWYTYGIWPQSWWAFTLFLFASMSLMLIREAIAKESKA